jgi:hypothetical protein
VSFVVYGFCETDPLIEFLLSGHPSLGLLGFRGRRIANRIAEKEERKEAENGN